MIWTRKEREKKESVSSETEQVSFFGEKPSAKKKKRITRKQKRHQVGKRGEEDIHNILQGRHEDLCTEGMVNKK